MNSPIVQNDLKRGGGFFLYLPTTASADLHLLEDRAIDGGAKEARPPSRSDLHDMS